MADQEQAALRLQVARLRQEHADFDAAVNAMVATGCDRLQVQRMKKKKLTIRDRLQDLEDQIILYSSTMLPQWMEPPNYSGMMLQKH